MGRDHDVSCVLCQRADETKITGPLSTKNHVTAHQNCLLFSSGIFCKNSPQFDDLFGFSVEDVIDEVKRGRKLMCRICKKKGATAGCEVRRCKRSYHYPCAVQDGAQMIEDLDEGKYELFCVKHEKQRQEQTSVNGCASSSSRHTSEAGPSKTDGNTSLELLSNGSLLMYCDKHAPSSHKRDTCGDSRAEGPSVYNSDSNSTGSMKHSPFKRRWSSIDNQQESPSKRRSEVWNRRMTDDSSDPDENGPDEDISIFAPLEFDLEESQPIRKDTESPTESMSGRQLDNESVDKNEDDDDDETDTESVSLLAPVRSSVEIPSHSTTNAATQTASTTHPVALTRVKVEETQDEESSPEQRPVHSPVPQQESTGSPPSHDHFTPSSVTGSPPCSSSAIPPTPLEIISSPAALPSEPETRIDSANFWKSCNAAGCTQAIFADFIDEMNHISSRIQSGQASQEDYYLALTVMEASGKLVELVTKQQEDLKHKQIELQRAAAAMMEVVAALKR